MCGYCGGYATVVLLVCCIGDVPLDDLVLCLYGGSVVLGMEEFIGEASLYDFWEVTGIEEFVFSLAGAVDEIAVGECIAYGGWMFFIGDSGVCYNVKTSREWEDKNESDDKKGVGFCFHRAGYFLRKSPVLLCFEVRYMHP